jgi:hypothetical protein
MKKPLIFTAILLICLSYGFAQKDSTSKKEFHTLLGNKKVSNGAYFGLSLGMTQISNHDALCSGGRLMWVINHGFGIGFGGSGFTNEIDSWENTNGISGGYGGLILEPIIAPRMPVHLSFPVLLGVGGVAKTNSDWENPDYSPENADVFLIAEPGAELELNLVKFIRISFGTSYRFTRSVHLSGYSSGFLENFSGNITLKFGKF